MWAALLAGAACAALLDGFLRLGLASDGLLREALLLSLAGDLALAWLIGGLLWLAGRRGERAPSTGAAFLLGFACAAAPLAGSLLPKPTFGLALPVLALILFLGPARRWRWRRAPFRVAAGGAHLLLAALVLLPTSLRVCPPEPGGVGAAAQGPDVLLISVDTLRADALDPERGLTPRLHELRARGTWAEYALSPSSQTIPAHYTMFTGLNVLQHGVYNNHQQLGGEVTLAERFRRHGYRTAGVVSSAPVRGDLGFERGFEVYHEAPMVTAGPTEALFRHARKNTWIGWCGLARPLPEAAQRCLTGRTQTDWDGHRGNGRHTTDDALEMLAALHRSEQPFFLFVHYMDPHAPYAPPESVRGRRAGWDPVAEEYRLRNGEVPEGDWRQANRIGTALRDGEPGLESAVAHLRALYEEEVLFIDSLIGELVDAVEEGGRPTVILFTSDHGEHFGEHDLMTHANSVYEALVRVPFILVGPGIPVRELDTPPHLEDVLPTLLGACGLLPEEGARALDPALLGRDLSAEQIAERAVHVAAQRTLPQHEGETEHERLMALRDGDWKLILAFDLESAERSVEPLELYDLASDAEERVNRIEEEPERVADMTERAAGLVASARRDSAGVTDEASRAMLDQLGY